MNNEEEGKEAVCLQKKKSWSSLCWCGAARQLVKLWANTGQAWTGSDHIVQLVLYFFEQSASRRLWVWFGPLQIKCVCLIDWLFPLTITQLSGLLVYSIFTHTHTHTVHKCKLIPRQHFADVVQRSNRFIILQHRFFLKQTKKRTTYYDVFVDVFYAMCRGSENR